MRHSVGQPRVCPLARAPTLECRGRHQTHEQAGQAQGPERKGLRWADLEARRPGRRGAGGGPGMERRCCPRVPRGQEPPGHGSSRARAICGPRTAHRHVLAFSFPCKTTQQPNVPSLHTRCSAEGDESRVLIY